MNNDNIQHSLQPTRQLHICPPSQHVSCRVATFPRMGLRRTDAHRFYFAHPPEPPAVPPSLHNRPAALCSQSPKWCFMPCGPGNTPGPATRKQAPDRPPSSSAGACCISNRARTPGSSRMVADTRCHGRGQNTISGSGSLQDKGRASTHGRGSPAQPLRRHA